MTNFFDIASYNEIKEIFGFAYEGKEKDEIRKKYEENPNMNYYFLTQLYVLRGDDKLAQDSLDKIKDDTLRLDAGMSWQEFKR